MGKTTSNWYDGYPWLWEKMGDGGEIAMKCPHCLESFFEKREEIDIGSDSEGYWQIRKFKCPSCNKWILFLYKRKSEGIFTDEVTSLFRPKAALRIAPPKEVTAKYADDYKEACAVLPDSPKASAALSRRSLQLILRDKAGVKPGNLSDEIQEAIDSKGFPPHIADSIDAVRTIGNFAAHSIKSRSSGEIVAVEPGEAEWSLDVIEALFEFYFVQPSILAAKRDALNHKLKDAGKPELKGA